MQNIDMEILLPDTGDPEDWANEFQKYMDTHPELCTFSVANSPVIEHSVLKTWFLGALLTGFCSFFKTPKTDDLVQQMSPHAKEVYEKVQKS